MKRKPSSRSHPAPDPKCWRVFLVEDHPITRYGLRRLLNGEPDLEMCGEAGNARAALSAIKPPLPDLVIADVAMPGKSIIEFIKDLKSLHPDLPVLILSTYDETIHAERLMRAGARGYIMKNEGGETLLKAIRQVLQGQSYLSPAMAARAIEAFAGRRERGGSAVLADLTDREFEIFQVIGQGKSSQEVAEQLCISPKTVEAHRLTLCQKLNLKSPAQLMLFAIQWHERKALTG